MLFRRLRRSPEFKKKTFGKFIVLYTGNAYWELYVNMVKMNILNFFLVYLRFVVFYSFEARVVKQNIRIHVTENIPI